MHKSLRIAFLFFTAVLLLTIGVGPTLAQTSININEIRIDQPSTDNDEYFELAGPSGATLDGLTYLVIGDGSGGSGVIEAVVDLTGNSIPASGFFVAAESTFTLATADLTTNLNFENSDNVTHLLVNGFTGFNGEDLDTNDDGTLDVTPWSDIVDSVALIETVGSGDLVYSSTTIGPDGSFVPGHVYLCPDLDGWTIGAFEGGQDTPGDANACVVEPLDLTIMEIQGSGLTSPYEGELVRTTGVVTLLTADGRSFWIQDPAGDGDPATSDGIFVFRGADVTPVAVGDGVSVTAYVQEYVTSTRPADQPLSELSSVAAVDILSSGNPLPAPVPLTDLPDESLVEGIAFWEPLEGMLASIDNAPVVAPTTDFGEFVVLAKDDAKPGSGFYPQEQQILIGSLGDNVVDYNPERIMVDDSSLSSPIVVMPGDRVQSLVGVVDYTFSNYKLQPASYDVTTHNLPNLPASTRSGDEGDTVITTFNVENLFDLDDNPDKEDEGSTPSPAALETQLTKLTAAIIVELELPDIIVVQEVENTAILQELGDRVNAAAGTAYTATSFETSDVRGIEVGFLWDANRVSLLDAYQMSGPDVEAAFGPSSPSPGREPLVGVFQIGDRQLTIIGNHFKSKSGDDALFGVNDPPVRVTEIQRKAQAQVVRDFVDVILAADPNALVMVAGDLNDFQFGEPGEGPDHPVAILEGSGDTALSDLIALEKDPERFSYVFDGNSQVLDHMLVSPALYGLVAGADMLHFNASFPYTLGSDASTPLRSSDHDSVEGRFWMR